jgi:hypothetical protein
MNTMAGIDFIDPEDYWLDPEGNVRRMGSTEEDGEQAIIATLTEACSDAEGMLLAQALDKVARNDRASR